MGKRNQYSVVQSHYVESMGIAKVSALLCYYYFSVSLCTSPIAACEYAVLEICHYPALLIIC